MSTFYIEEIDGQTDFQNETLEIGKKEINLLLVLEADGKSQFNDTVNTIWEVKHIDSFANLNTFKEWNKKYDYKNVCVVHHGNTFSDHNFDKYKKVILGPNMIKAIKDAILKLGEKPDDEYNNDYIEKLVNETEGYTRTINREQLKGLGKNSIESFFCLKMLVGGILEGGNFFSIACNEADDINFLTEIAEFSKRNIKIFANSNFTSIKLNYNYPKSNPVISGYGSILNAYLTSPEYWNDSSGWKYYDTKTKTLTVTKKDLWLYSTKTKIYTLLPRQRNLTYEQNQKQEYAQMYYSKKFKREFINRKETGWGQEGYDSWKKGTEAKFTDFK